MNEHYHYLTLQAHREQLASVRSALCEPAGPELARSGGAVIGAWLGTGSIGWPDDEVIALIGWSSQPGELGGWVRDLGVETWSAVPLQATVRPNGPAPVQATGVHAHRWLEVQPGQLDEVVELSAPAWVAFEASFQSHIEGLFRTTDGSNRLLLVTWYASVAEWERSRGVPETAHADLPAARQRFQRRRQLTTRQIVRISTPLPLSNTPPPAGSSI